MTMLSPASSTTFSKDTLLTAKACTTRQTAARPKPRRPRPIRLGPANAATLRQELCLLTSQVVRLQMFSLDTRPDRRLPASADVDHKARRPASKLHTSMADLSLQFRLARPFAVLAVDRQVVLVVRPTARLPVRVNKDAVGKTAAVGPAAPL